MSTVCQVRESYKPPKKREAQGDHATFSAQDEHVIRRRDQSTSEQVLSPESGELVIREPLERQFMTLQPPRHMGFNFLQDRNGRAKTDQRGVHRHVSTRQGEMQEIRQSPR